MFGPPFNAERSWFLKDDEPGFRDAIVEIGKQVAQDVSAPITTGTLGDEHEECQHIFSKLHTILQERCSDLTRLLLRSSRIENPVIEYRYYQSRRRSKTGETRFVEKETGADFALTVSVDLPGVVETQRSILGQGKVVRGATTPVDRKQLERLLTVAGSESALYFLWGVWVNPYFVTAQNISCAIGNSTSEVLPEDIAALGRGLGEFLCDEFIGLWFGRLYVDERDGPAPRGTIGVLYQFLHQSSPPPNVVYFGISSSERRNVPPGMYVLDRKDIE